MKTIRSLSLLAFICCVYVVPCVAASDEKCDDLYGKGSARFSLATGSPGELGLLKQLADAFNSGKNTAMCWHKAGSGGSLKLLKDKRVDMIMVHAPKGEKKAIEEGWAKGRTRIGSNEFYIVGPLDDPANISSAKTAVEAYTGIASSKAKFFSRGDNSGTHMKEVDIWKKAGISPVGDWYVVTNDFMVATLKRANAEKGYFMTDSSTWVAEKKAVPDLKILFRGDKYIVNVYHALLQPDGVTPGAATAAKFMEFVASKDGQGIIRNYGKDKYGEGLYNDSEYAKKYDN